MSTDFRPFVKFINRLAFTFVIMCLLTIPLFAKYVQSIKAAGEFLSSDDLAKISTTRPVLWWSGFTDNGWMYKTGIAERIHPKVVVFGNSRTLQFRGAMFAELPRHEFYNMGTNCRSMQDAWDSLSQLCDAGAKPRLILLGIDWSWFLPNVHESLVQQVVDRLAHSDTAFRFSVWRTRIRRAKIFLLDQIQLLQTAWRDPRFDEGSFRDLVNGRELIGIGARDTLKAGYRNDGSYCYTHLLDQYGVQIDRAQQVEDGWALNWTYRFRGSLLEENAVESLERFLILSHQQDVRVIVYLPPMYPELLAKLRTSEVSAPFWRLFSRKVEEACALRGVPFHDFSDLASFGGLPQDMLDSTHSSEKMDIQILLKMFEHPVTREILSNLVDVDRLMKEMEASDGFLVYGD